MSALIVTHDPGLAWNIADTVAMMKRGEIVENGPAGEVLAVPQHACTRDLLTAVPQLGSQSLVRSGAASDGSGDSPARAVSGVSPQERVTPTGSDRS